LKVKKTSPIVGQCLKVKKQEYCRLMFEGKNMPIVGQCLNVLLQAYCRLMFQGNKNRPIVG